MNIVLQRINSCELFVDNNLISKVGFGFLVLVGVHGSDTPEIADELAKKIASIRVFNDDNGKINKDIIDVKGDILCVSNFTLVANTKTGTRPDFSKAGDFNHAKEIYLRLADKLKENGVNNVQLGCFGEHMVLNSSFDGPYTIELSKQI